MKAASIVSKLKSQGRDATRLDSSTVAVRVPQARLIPESVALLRETGWRAVGEYDPETGACRVVLRNSAGLTV